MHKIWSVFPGIFTIHAWSWLMKLCLFLFPSSSPSKYNYDMKQCISWAYTQCFKLPRTTTRPKGMHRLHSKGNGIMALINLKLHLNLCSSGNFHFEQQYAFSQGILGAIYKPCGSFFGLAFWPPPSPMWIVLLYRLC